MQPKFGYSPQQKESSVPVIGVVTCVDDGFGNLTPVSQFGGGGASTTTMSQAFYKVTTAFSGAAAGDVLVNVQIINNANGSIVASTWTNTATGVQLSAAPSADDIAQQSAQSITDAQLRASPVVVQTQYSQLMRDSSNKLYFLSFNPGKPPNTYALDGTAYTPIGSSVPADSASISTAYFTNNGVAYTLPASPPNLNNAWVSFNGIHYGDNGVDWKVTGLTLTILNPVIASHAGDQFKFQWF